MISLHLILWDSLYELQCLASSSSTIKMQRESRCILILWDSFYELQCLASSSSTIYFWPDDSLVVEAETCCHLK